jgi:cytidine deaminase
MHFTDIQLIARAKNVARKSRVSESMSIGYVGCALVTDKGHVYEGVSIEAFCGIGFCAESSAISAMLTAGEHRIQRIVAIDANGKILPPCGRCREVIRQADAKNVRTRVIIGQKKFIFLRQLLPSIWQEAAFPKRKSQRK